MIIYSRSWSLAGGADGLGHPEHQGRAEASSILEHSILTIVHIT